MEKTKQTGAPYPENTRKILKKYARREAQAMQAFEQARRDLKKAEQKLTRATRNLQEQQAYLQECENKLSELRSARRTFQNSTEDSPENDTQEVPEEVISILAVEAPGAAETTAAESGIIAAVEEALREMADVEEAVEKAVNEIAEEARPPVVQTVFDANETVTMEEFTLQEMLSGNDSPSTDNNATQDLVDPGEEQAPTPNPLSGGRDDIDLEQEMGSEQISAESSQQPTRKTPARRPRTDTSSTTRSSTTRRGTPSSRSRSNNAKKSSDESSE